MLDSALVEEMISWRRHLHANPEFGFEVEGTAAFVAEKLRGFGIEVTERVGGTGVVGTLRRGGGNRSIGLRADMDALQIREAGDRPHRSRHSGLMHACGHDGHVAMLLGAAKRLATSESFSGTVQFIFQPAEEWGSGALAMLEDGLVDRFPMDEIYGMHNWPGLELGKIATTAGAMMAAEDNFEIVVQGKGGHAARPHQARDPLVAGCAIVTALQSIVSRTLDPAATSVVSVTEFETDGARNILPGTVHIRGDCRTFRSDGSAQIKGAMERISTGVATAHGCDASLSYETSFVPLINDPDATAAAVEAAAAVVGPANVDGRFSPVAASEDFAQLLKQVPGCFLFIGNGLESQPLHNCEYDFNDEALACGAALHVELVRQRLGQRPSSATVEK